MLGGKEKKQQDRILINSGLMLIEESDKMLIERKGPRTIRRDFSTGMQE